MSKRARLFIDYETYFDDDYTLKKMPTAQYLRDERFQLLGAAMAAPGYIEPGWYTPGNGLGRALASLPWPNVEIIAHNVTFDAAVLATHAPQFRPAYHTCTLMRTRYAISQGILPADRGTALAELGNKGNTAGAVAAGGEKLKSYALQDLRDLMTLYVESEGWQIPRMELDLMDLHARMACYPVLSLRRELLEEVAAREPSDMVKQVRKKKVFLAMLEQLGVEPGMKESPRTGKTTYAFAKTDRFMRELATHRDPRVRLLHELRTEGGSNIDRTRAQRFLDIGEPLPVPLLYYAAHTGRTGGMDKVNLQNLKRGGDLRRSIIAPKGYVLVVVDSGQVEVRTLAWLAGEQRLLQLFREGKDPYIDFAANVMFNIAPEDVTKAQRQIAKPPILAAGFGQGVMGLIAYASGMGIHLDEAQAKRAVFGYRDRYPAIVQYWADTFEHILHNGYTELPSGRRLTYPDLMHEGRETYYLRHRIFSKKHVGKRDKEKIWGGKTCENATQAAARDVVMWQTLPLSKRWNVVLSVHDEAVMCVPEDQAEECKAEALHWFSQTPPWAEGLPLEGEAIVTDNYSEKP